MTRIALKSLAARRLRTALTALAIVLGVAMVSGAFTLTDSGRPVAVSPLPAPPEADPRVAPFAALALALLEDRERPTFTDGLQAQRLMDAVRKLGSSS